MTQDLGPLFFSTKTLLIFCCAIFRKYRVSIEQGLPNRSYKLKLLFSYWIPYKVTLVPLYDTLVATVRALHDHAFDIFENLNNFNVKRGFIDL